jgi:hypothetical protein
MYSHQICDETGASVFSYLNQKGRLCVTFSNFACPRSQFDELLDTFHNIMRSRGKVQKSPHMLKYKNIHARICSDFVVRVFECELESVPLLITVDARFDKKRLACEITCTLKKEGTLLVFGNVCKHASWSRDPDAEHARTILDNFRPEWILDRVR